MLKPLLTALICCLFSGCAAFTTSQTWQKVVHVRPDSFSDQADTSDAYAAKLHRVLKAASVDHKVVTYEYHYLTCLREEAVGTHTAVLYRDNIDPKNPWWLMEDRLAKPVWVSGDHLDDQVAFYIHHHVDVVNEKDFPANGEDHKTTVAIARSANGYRENGFLRRSVSLGSRHDLRFVQLGGSPENGDAPTRCVPASATFGFADALGFRGG
jgi:hypothetical protein